MTHDDILIRKARAEDLPALTRLFGIARAFMAANGNPTQWTAGYPAEQLLREQTEAGFCHVCLKGGRIVATFTLMPGPDPTYARIEGSWPDGRDYHVVHRLASDGSVRGLADLCLRWCLERCPVLRVDTHRDNAVMRHVLRKNGFRYCGIIRVANGTERLAFQAEGAPHPAGN